MADSEDRPPSIFSTASRKKKLFTTALLYYGIFALGPVMIALNASALDFARKFGIESDELSIVFTMITAGYLFGALLGLIFLNFVNRQHFILFFYTMMTAAFFAAVFAESKLELCIVAGFLGTGCGAFDCCSIAWIIDIWRHEAAPFILTEHFSYAVGTVITPLILGPFLTDEKDEDEEEGGTTISDISSSSSAPFESQLTTPFMICGSLIAAALAMQIFLYFLYRNATINKTDDSEPSDSPAKLEEQDMKKKSSVVSATAKSFVMPPDTLVRKLVLTVLCVGVCSFYQGLELSTGSFIPMFGHYSPVKFTDAEGAKLSLWMNVGFAVGRFAGIFIVLKIAPHFIIVTALAILTAANTILLTVGGSDPTWLWVGTVMFGVGMSCVFPSLFAYVEKYLFITNSVSATLLLMGGGISAAYPFIIGDSIKENPSIMTYVNFFSLAVCSASFTILFWITFVRERRFKKKHQQGKNLSD